MKESRRKFLRRVGIAMTALSGSGIVFVTVSQLAIRHYMKEAGREARLIVDGIIEGKTLDALSEECEQFLSTVPSREPVMAPAIEKNTLVILIADRAAGTMAAWKGAIVEENGTENVFHLKRIGVYVKGNKSLPADEAEDVYRKGEIIIRRTFRSPQIKQPGGGNSIT